MPALTAPGGYTAMDIRITRRGRLNDRETQCPHRNHGKMTDYHRAGAARGRGWYAGEPGGSRHRVGLAGGGGGAVSPKAHSWLRVGSVAADKDGEKERRRW